MKIGCGIIIGIVVVLALIAFAVVWFVGSNAGAIHEGFGG